MKFFKRQAVQTALPSRTKEQKRADIVRYIKRDWQLHIMILIPIIWTLIFVYVPMYGAQIAFRDYNPFKPMLESEWVGFYWFEKFLKANNFKKLFSNTVILSLYGQIVSFPMPIIFALMMNALRQKKFAGAVSIISYMPSYLSTTVMVGVMMMLLSPVYGLYGNIYRFFGGTGYPYDFRATAGAFRHLYVWSGIWQGFGAGSMLYTAALTGVSMELHEAAMIDGASRLKRCLYVDLPAITPTIVIKLIMMAGALVGVGFDKTYLMQTNLNRGVSEVIETYVYSYGLTDPNNFSYASALGLFNSMINLALMIIVNKICKKVSEGELSLW